MKAHRLFTGALFVFGAVALNPTATRYLVVKHRSRNQMPTISRFYGILIRMYANDHNPPHVHADMGRYRSVIFIDTLEWRTDPLPGRARKLVKEWVAPPRRTAGELGTMPSKSAIDTYIPVTVMVPRWEVTEVSATGPLTVTVTFVDGTAGVVRFKPTHLYGIFAPLADPAFFEKVHVEDGAVAWPGDIDLAPDAMYDEIKARGEWVLA